MKRKLRNISQELNYRSLNKISNRFILKYREGQMKSIFDVNKKPL